MVEMFAQSDAVGNTVTVTVCRCARCQSSGLASGPRYGKMLRANLSASRMRSPAAGGSTAGLVREQRRKATRN
jgi:hypothetical protein